MVDCNVAYSGLLNLGLDNAIIYAFTYIKKVHYIFLNSFTTEKEFLEAQIINGNFIKLSTALIKYLR